jgi:hypothetical protein
VTLTLVPGAGPPEAAPLATPGAMPVATPGAAPGEGPPVPPVAPESPSSGGSGRATAGIIVMGVGGAALVEGIIPGVLAIGKHGTLVTACPMGRCLPDESSAVSSYNTLGTLSTVGFIAGGVGIVGGGILFLTAPRHSATTPPATGLRIQPWIGFGSAGATGTF